MSHSYTADPLGILDNYGVDQITRTIDTSDTRIPQANAYVKLESYEMSVEEPKVSTIKSSPLLESGFYDIQRSLSADPFYHPPPPPPMMAPIKEYPIRDVRALRELLSQMDMSHFGFSKDLRKATSDRALSALRTPISKRTTSTKNRSTSEDDDFQSDGDGIFNTPRITSIKIKKPKPHQAVTAISLASLSPMGSPRHSDILRSTSSSPRSPYKGRHGANPCCASCHTYKTPYWRDSWNQGFILCNACGLRYSKFRRRCGTCNYVPRKEDKNARSCTQCSGVWVQ